MHKATAPALCALTVQVKITIPQALKEVDGIYGGYILFTPTDPTATTESTGNTRRKKSRVLVASAAALSDGPVPLSVPYQGSSKDYSTIGQDNSLALFVPPLFDLDRTSAEALDSKPSLFLCDNEGAGKCGYSATTLKADPSVYKGFRFASTLLRPVADVRVQVRQPTGTQAFMHHSLHAASGACIMLT